MMDEKKRLSESEWQGTEISEDAVKKCDPDLELEDSKLTLKLSGLFQDSERRSAFCPYRPKSTVLTNVQRGNVSTEAEIVEPADLTFHQQAAMGELTEEDVFSDPCRDTPDSNGLTPMMWASAYGQVPTLKLFLKCGVDVSFRGPEDETAIMLAAAGGHHDAVSALITSGAVVNDVDENCNTALMYAAYGNHPHTINELLENGADLSMKNLNDDTAFSIAVNRGSRAAQIVMEQYLLRGLDMI